MIRPRLASRCLCLSMSFAIALQSFSLDAKDKEAPPQELLSKKLLFADDFETTDGGRWEPTDKAAWKIAEQNGNHVFNQFQKSDFKPKVRSPFNRALLKDVDVANFVIDVKLQSTHPDYGHRDMCLFFGYQDDSHLYYVHLGKKMDPHANNIFIVNGEPRKSISITTTPGTNWDDEWHHARVVRNVKTGSIEVYFDDMQKPVMTAEDTTFGHGRVGIGTFDDTGNFDDFRLYGDLYSAR